MSETRAGARQGFGRRGEDVAAAYLTDQGYSIIERNWRTHGGELDLIARSGDWLVCVEVRARHRRQGDEAPPFGTPEESVTQRKQARLAALGETYVAEVGWPGPWRVDIIALEFLPNGTLARINHLADAIGRPSPGR